MTERQRAASEWLDNLARNYSPRVFRQREEERARIAQQQEEERNFPQPDTQPTEGTIASTNAPVNYPLMQGRTPATNNVPRGAAFTRNNQPAAPMEQATTNAPMPRPLRPALPLARDPEPEPPSSLQLTTLTTQPNVPLNQPIAPDAAQEPLQQPEIANLVPANSIPEAQSQPVPSLNIEERLDVSQQQPGPGGLSPESVQPNLQQQVNPQGAQQNSAVLSSPELARDTSINLDVQDASNSGTGNQFLANSMIDQLGDTSFISTESQNPLSQSMMDPSTQNKGKFGLLSGFGNRLLGVFTGNKGQKFTNDIGKVGSASRTPRNRQSSPGPDTDSIVDINTGNTNQQNTGIQSTNIANPNQQITGQAVSDQGTTGTNTQNNNQGGENQRK
ncbi:hypothetical protein ABW19_dt0203336 [Dactylella cylindrospora]|nr:hypothetical protein ABW19_dt0203336 [Dactylella cylindrospora]